MTPTLFLDDAVTPALHLLPPAMDSPSARAMILAICLQESKLNARVQGGGGPAHGYPQFEKTGIKGVLEHRASALHAITLCEVLDVDPTVLGVYAAIIYNDTLAAGFSRLLLWTDPEPLPGYGGVDRGWQIYLRTWRPGKPRPKDWPENFKMGWEYA